LATADRREGALSISTGFPRLDKALSIGGLPKGRISEFLGHPTSGKTTLALKFLAQAQGERAQVCYVDPSHLFDPNYAHRCGLDLSRLLVSTPLDWAEMLATVEALVHSGAFSAAVVDATGCTEMGRQLDSVLRRLLAPLGQTGTALIFVSDTPARSTGLAHYASVRLQVVRERWLQDNGDIYGYQARVRILKSRFGPSERSVSLSLRFDTSENDGLYLLEARQAVEDREDTSAEDNGRLAYTTRELADLAGVSAARIRHLLLTGEIQGRKFGPVWWIPKSEAKGWLERRKKQV
jgi:recombination protein RecA